MNIHYHTFYLFDNVPLRYTQHGYNWSVHPLHEVSENRHKQEIRVQKKIEQQVSGYLALERKHPSLNDIWVAICYWNTGMWAVRMDWGRAPNVIN